MEKLLENDEYLDEEKDCYLDILFESEFNFVGSKTFDQWFNDGKVQVRVEGYGKRYYYDVEFKYENEYIDEFSAKLVDTKEVTLNKLTGNKEVVGGEAGDYYEKW